LFFLFLLPLLLLLSFSFFFSPIVRSSSFLSEFGAQKSRVIARMSLNGRRSEDVPMQNYIPSSRRTFARFKPRVEKKRREISRENIATRKRLRRLINIYNITLLAVVLMEKTQ